MPSTRVPPGEPLRTATRRGLTRATRSPFHVAAIQTLPKPDRSRASLRDDGATPDFRGCVHRATTILAAHLPVAKHRHLTTVPRRHRQADFDPSQQLLQSLEPRHGPWVGPSHHADTQACAAGV